MISPSDQKRLLLLEPSYPRFLGTSKYRRSSTRGSPKKGSNTDSGISGSDTDDSDKEEDDAVHVIGSEETNGEFSEPLHPDMVEVRTDGDSIEIKLGSNITGSNAVQEAYCDVFCMHFGKHFAKQWLGEEGLATLVGTSTQGKPDNDGDDDPANVGLDTNEDELIAQKTEFERDFILEFRSLFSENLFHNRYL